MSSELVLLGGDSLAGRELVEPLFLRLGFEKLRERIPTWLR